MSGSLLLDDHIRRADDRKDPASSLAQFGAHAIEDLQELPLAFRKARSFWRVRAGRKATKHLTQLSAGLLETLRG